MASGIHLGATLQQLCLLGFPGSQLDGVGDVEEAPFVGDEQVAVEVGGPVAPLVAMQEHSDGLAVGLQHGDGGAMGRHCQCRHRVQQNHGGDDG